MCSKNGLKHIFLNLLKNASEALGEDGEVEIRTSIAENVLSTERGLKKDAIRIIVQDNGPGLPEVVMKNLFKPYITTKNSGHSGLGLSIVKTMVSDMNGSIACKSTIDGGTCFTLHFPIEEGYINMVD